MRQPAGYRNRIFYHEITELHTICTGRSKDIELILNRIVAWLKSHPDKLDHTI